MCLNSREISAVNLRTDGVRISIAQVNAPQRVRRTRRHWLRRRRNIGFLDEGTIHAVLDFSLEKNACRIDPVADLKGRDVIQLVPTLSE
jgi:hypothetical protein